MQQFKLIKALISYSVFKTIENTYTHKSYLVENGFRVMISRMGLRHNNSFKWIDTNLGTKTEKVHFGSLLSTFFKDAHKGGQWEEGNKILQGGKLGD